ncbi:MAG: UvrB/UvrC motif-containing protein [Candidatus Omnitrophota bacterium]
MQCDICGKSDATVHLTEIVNEEVTKLHLCEECARKKGAEMEEHFGLSDLLAGLADLGTDLEPTAIKTAKCDECGLTYENFRKMGKLGCGVCYEAFKGQLLPLLKKIHGSDRHIGKIPVKFGRKIADAKRLQDMKMKMEKAIQFEEFEEAARLRDEIKKIEFSSPPDKKKDPK